MERRYILIVEDDKDIGMIEEAISVLEKESFNLILLDLMLPGKNGYDICRAVRDKLDIPILMVTARTGCFFRVACKRTE